jgi:hypothetical protein
MTHILFLDEMTDPKHTAPVQAAVYAILKTATLPIKIESKP